VLGVPFDFSAADQRELETLEELATKLMGEFRAKSKLVEMNYRDWGKMKIQCIYPRLSKPVIDEIDRVLGLHYGFTEEELDFIVNYDIKYRLGLDAGDEGD